MIFLWGFVGAVIGTAIGISLVLLYVRHVFKDY